MDTRPAGFTFDTLHRAQEIRGVTSDWLALRVHLEDGERAMPIGAAAGHSSAARQEAATKLILNHANVRRDIANPSTEWAILGDSRPLTQTELRRLDISDSPHVCGFLREVSRRLLGGAPFLEVRLDLSTPQQARAWLHSAAYLEGRLQTAAEQMPGRERDMGPAAGDAMVAVMTEIAENAGAWLSLRQLLGSSVCGAGEEGGAAAAHSHNAREEAARKLILNHGAVRMDIANPFPNQSIKGNKLSQARSLARVPHEDAGYVDQFLREVARRLLAGMSGAPRLEVRLNPSLPPQARAWEQAATYLAQRIQSTPQQSPGREPDMSPEAAAAMKAVIAEVHQMSTSLLADMKARGLGTSAMPHATRASTERRDRSVESHTGPVPKAHEAQPLRESSQNIQSEPMGKPVVLSTADVRQQASLAVRKLTQAKDSGFRKWIGSKASQAMLDSWSELLIESVSTPEALSACARKHFGSYQMPSDVGRAALEPQTYAPGPSLGRVPCCCSASAPLG